MPPAPPTLPDELIEEIFLRLPPEEPEWLVRASLASKLWLGRLTAPRFHGRYSEFHRVPPMLGFFYSSPFTSEEPTFVSTTKFPVCIANPGNSGHSAKAWDCRHGRLLLGPRDMSESPEKVVVLDPITGCRRELDAPEYYSSYAGAVLCAVKGCDHRACHGGPSRVVFVGLDIDDEGYAYACAYESLPETGDSRLRQSSNACLYLGLDAEIELLPPVLIQDTLYFMLQHFDDRRAGILKYDMCCKCLSPIDAPLAVEYNITILMGMKDGSLGFAHLDGLTLNLWSRQMGSDRVGSWSECRVIDLKEILPAPIERLRLMGSVEGGDIIFVMAELGLYQINLESLEWKKIWKQEPFRNLIPYMRFYHLQERANPCDVAH